ncbi:Cytosine/purine/uracil/thiamine/allantoin permease family protein [Leucobacter sp. 7(1)]|uniref:purine-cytosine permease family protein n=1 Tax=Leucobacter sp. 7(1) TaxID=1255613 RepID=UPI00097F30AB|nr:cytosine permease [Leucobacter sp. 7(1)]SJN11525.1 Cytosine/purine/uracil/thiamine/allantoin permease family protein [Leucobacter sp. 7(1)]
MTTGHPDSPAESLMTREIRTIERVPERERHGRPSNQFTLWFGVNMTITAVVDGALAVTFGTEALAAIIGLFIGNLLGGITMALHSAQGPRLGLPQMISSRVQFGVKGAALPLILSVLMYLGFQMTGIVLCGQAINLIFGWNIPIVGMIVFGLMTTVIAVVGYRLIHVIGRIAAVVGAVGFGYVAIRLFLGYDVSSAFGQVEFSSASFLLAVALAAGWQMTFAPYVADYSRYLPSKTTVRSTFWMTLLGTVLGGQIAMTLGVLIAGTVGTEVFLGNQVGTVGTIAGGGIIATLMYVVIVVNKLSVNSLNAYGGFMCILTIITGWTKQRHISQALRTGIIVAFTLLALVFAIVANEVGFLGVFKNFVLALLSVFVPWSVINLVDYYLISKERVNIPALYEDNGPYKDFNWIAIGCYFFGVLVQLPFMNQALYEGPLAKAMGGADISWIVAIVATALVYYPLAKRTQYVPDELITGDEDAHAGVDSRSAVSG